MSELSIEPAVLLARYTVPVLLVQGTREQVSARDAELLKHANPNAKLIVIPNANHVFKAVLTADRNANVATYSESGLPLVDGLVEDVSNFIFKFPIHPH